jgi:type IV pilus assembly protein PilY1
LRLNSGFLQYAYAGDYLGRVWRFDLSSIRGTQSTPVISVGTHIFTAVKNGIAQPITSRITVANSYNSIDVPNKWFLFFGTGSDLTATTTDALSTSVQSMYGVIDPPDAQCSSTSTISNTRKPASDTSQCGLTQIGEISTSTAWTSGGYTVNARTFAAKGYMSQKVDGVWQVKRDGWVMDWTAPADSVSEKVFSAATVRNATTPTLLVSSNIINTNSCQSSGVGFLNAMDAYHGGSLGASYFDINRDHKFADETIDGAAISSIDFGIGNIGKSNNPGNNVVVQGNTGKDNYTGGSNAPGVRNDSTGTQGGSLVPRRISWREIVK